MDVEKPSRSDGVRNVVAAVESDGLPKSPPCVDFGNAALSGAKQSSTASAVYRISRLSSVRRRRKLAHSEALCVSE